MVRDSQIGFYVTKSGSEVSRALAQSGFPSAFEMDNTVGNTGTVVLFTRAGTIHYFILYDMVRINTLLLYNDDANNFLFSLP